MKAFTTPPEAFAALEQPLVEMIVKAARPERIFLLGASFCERTSESIFCEPAPASRQLSGCTLLIVLEQLWGKELHEWQDKIEAHCKALLPVTAIVMQASTFEEGLKQGHRFAQKVSGSAALIYDSGRSELPTPQNTNDSTDQPLERQCREGLEKAREFLAGSELYRLRKQYSMAAFMLHQSAEQALRTLLKAGTGYHATTHSLERLLRYAGLVRGELSDLFAERSEEEKRLFQLLQKAYIDSRYREDYKITGRELLLLSQKVGLLHQIAEEGVESVCHTPVLSTV